MIRPTQIILFPGVGQDALSKMLTSSGIKNTSFNHRNWKPGKSFIEDELYEIAQGELSKAMLDIDVKYILIDIPIVISGVHVIMVLPADVKIAKELVHAGGNKGREVETALEKFQDVAKTNSVQVLRVRTTNEMISYFSKMKENKGNDQLSITSESDDTKLEEYFD